MASAAMKGRERAESHTRRVISEGERWDAVVRCDSSTDGTFYYSVRTTGVYCRPSCASKLPRRENVSFHPTCQEAERAGFRACKRCRPGERSLAEQHAAVVEAACRMIEASDGTSSLDVLARTAGMSRFHFHRVFKAITGVTPKAYGAAHRARCVRDELSQVSRNTTVTRAIYEAGFNSSGRFYANSSEMLGMTPTHFRSGGRTTSIRFAVGESSLGSFVVSATDKGVCAILLGDDPDALLRELQDRFPNAELIGGDTKFEETVATVVAFLEKPALGLNLPLDIRGTAFQQRVWQALREIPAGSTASYTDVAERIGSPRSVRAVAQACAANAIVCWG